jgi:phage shock protein C
MNRRLFRSRTDRALGGVAAGLAKYLRVEVALVRLILIVSTPLTGGLAFFAYLIAWAALPLERGLPEAAAVTFGAPPDPTEATPSSLAQPRLGSLGMVFGGFFVALGAWFMLEEYVPGFEYSFPWPLIIIGLGVLILASSTARRQEESGGQGRE